MWTGQAFRLRSRVVGVTAFFQNSLMMLGTRNGKSRWIPLNDTATSFLERRRMYLGKRKPYLTETCSFPGTDPLLDSFKTNLLISSGQWVALIILHLVLRMYNNCSSPDWTARSTFFAKLKWTEVALATMVTSQWLSVLKEHPLATETTKSIPVLFVLSFTLQSNLSNQRSFSWYNVIFR